MKGRTRIIGSYWNNCLIGKKALFNWNYEISEWGGGVKKNSKKADNFSR